MDIIYFKEGDVLILFDKDDIKDVEFTESQVSKSIRGKALFYSTSQVSHILGEVESKIRYYTKEFDGILNIEISNKQRRYVEQDIEKLRFIIGLKNDGMTIKQIKEYCEEIDFNEENGITIKEDNPLHIQAVAKALMEEQSKQMELFKQQIIDLMNENIKQQVSAYKIMNDELLKEVSITVDDVISDKLDDFKQGMITEIESGFMKELEATREMNEKLDSMREIMESRSDRNKKKGLFGRIFG